MPIQRARDVLTGIFLLEMREATFQVGSVGQRPRLVGGPGTEAGNAVAGGVIGVGFSIGHALNGALDADLAAQGFPVE
jgi:hypothetical protein